MLLRFFTLVLAAVFLVTASCSRAPDLVGIDNPEIPVAAVKTATKRKIYMATTREASDVIGAFYSAERAPELGLASVVVSIPPNHETGNIERARQLPPDPRTEFAIIEPTTYGSDNAFLASINRELAARPASAREVLLFVHGYNNTVSDSLLRIAQFVEDTEFDGVAVLFSWASAAKATRYVYDLNSALIARQKLLHAADIIRRSNTRKIDLFAHSMGSLLTVEAIVQAEISGSFNTSGLLGNVMLAAPDIDVDLFAAQLNYLKPEDRDFFVFISEDDKALGFSSRLSGGISRAGDADPAFLTQLGVTVIDLSEVDDSTSGSHSKFAGSPEVVQLIGNGLKKQHFNQPTNVPTLIEVLDGVPVLRVLTP